MGHERGVVVVTGIGGMGVAVARRCGSGSHLLLADVSTEAADAAASILRREGHDVTCVGADVSDRNSVDAMVDAARSLGEVHSVVHTAGVSPVQAPAERVLAVDLVGTANVLEAFADVIAPGGAAVVIASMSGYLVPPLSADDERALVRSRAADLLAVDCVQGARSMDSGMAYAFAKQAAVVKVRAAALEWGRRGARVNAISPGVIATAMGQAELDGPSGAFMRLMVESSAMARLGTPDDIAGAVAFLLGRDAAFITGADLLVDGGVIAAMRSGQVDFGSAMD
jgi:NAD(P)-dependent dehydrogenase (short-subunit alcohol dehydrogenase family)